MNTQFFILSSAGYVIVFIFAFWLGKRAKSETTCPKCRIPSTDDEMKEMRKEAQEAISARTNKRKERVMLVAQKQGRITNDDIEDMFCISDSTARHYLNELEHEGKLKQIGESGRGVYYIPV